MSGIISAILYRNLSAAVRKTSMNCAQECKPSTTACGLAQNLILLIRQNDGTLSKKKRENEFSALTDDEVQRLENIIQDVFEGFDDVATKR